MKCHLEGFKVATFPSTITSDVPSASDSVSKFAPKIFSFYNFFFLLIPVPIFRQVRKNPNKLLEVSVEEEEEL